MTLWMDCDIIATNFELQSHYYDNFWTNLLISTSHRLVVPLILSYKDGFNIK